MEEYPCSTACQGHGVDGGSIAGTHSRTHCTQTCGQEETCSCQCSHDNPAVYEGIHPQEAVQGHATGSPRDPVAGQETPSGCHGCAPSLAVTSSYFSGEGVSGKAVSGEEAPRIAGRRGADLGCLERVHATTGISCDASHGGVASGKV